MFKKLLLATTLISGATALEVTKVWESEPVLKVPESVLLDSQNSQLFVANINGKPSAKDGNGFISILNLDGKVKTLEFSKGFDAPKGMGIYENKLYVADRDTLRVVDLSTGKIIQNHTIKEAKFLNDVAIAKNGVVYVSDFSEKNKAIYQIKNNKISKFLNAKQLLEQRPNGLWLEEKELVIGTKEGTIFKANLHTKKLKVFKAHIGVNGIDGILPFDENSYITSDWAGRVFISSKNKTEKIIDGSGDKVNAADIWYDIKSQMLYIPTFFDNRILGYKVK